MAKYNVKFIYTTEVNIEVYALDEEVARELAWEKLGDMSYLSLSSHLADKRNLDGSEVEQID